jgi:serine/threonine protein kinase
MGGPAMKTVSLRSPEHDAPRSLLNRIVPKLSHGDDLFREQLARTAATIDRAFAVVLVAEWLIGIVLALVVSPLTWAGPQSSVHIHVWAALALGGIVALPPAALAWFRPGHAWTRHTIAAAQMLTAALWIHLTGGRIETHFMIFGSLAFLAAYRDWKVLITASVVVLVDHLVRGWFFPRSVYGVDSASIWRGFEHIGWVVFECLFLVFIIKRGNTVQQSAALDKLGEMGQYILGERLGGGGMGDVFLAEHRLLKRPCAIKLIRPDRTREAGILTRFEREVRATASLRHPNTVSVYDYGNLDDGSFFYVMEYLPGLSFQQLVEVHGPLPPGRAVYLLRQVCGALHEAHSIGLVHRDIKPDNILTCRLGGKHDVAKLFDFGLVQSMFTGAAASRLTQTGSIVGTPDYMSPEQVSGLAIDHRSDVFSLGAVAYFLLTGRVPFDGDDPLSVMYARLKEPARPPRFHRPEIPNDLEHIVLRCLDREVAARFADASVLERALAGCPAAAEWDDERAKTWWESLPAASTASITPAGPPTAQFPRQQTPTDFREPAPKTFRG